jgi:penicillin amidase
VELRTLGLRRAAERSLAVLSPATQAALEAYAAGVNAFVGGHPLPPEYAALELSQFEPWTPVDSIAVAKLIAFSLSFDLDIDATLTLLSYQQAGARLGFDGTALYFEDLFRSAPFDPAATVPDASVSPLVPVPGPRAMPSRELHPMALELARRYLGRIEGIPLLERLRARDRDRRGGSNAWAVSGAHTESGLPLVANDPHLPLDTPSIFYPIHLTAGRLNVTGQSFAGAPFVVVGHNAHIAWGATRNPMDVTDTFLEQVVPDPASPSGLSVVHRGQREPIVGIPEVFRRNTLDGVLDNVTVVPPGGQIPAATHVVPRRNNGPIVELDLASGTALSVQYTGFSATRELDASRLSNEAQDLDAFRHALQFFDVGSQNWIYADVRGTIAYFTSGEMPLREDLQSGTVLGLPPFFIRDGTGGNEWLPLGTPQPDQAVPYEILPAGEMPNLVNPPAGVIVTANNDPAGTTLDNDPLNQLRPEGGIFYLNPGYDGIRGGRITQMIRERLAGGGKLSFADMQRMQADTALLDAQVFVPHIAGALARARTPGAQARLAALAADPRVAEAVGRLASWDLTTPTGILEGYDARDQRGALSAPSHDERAASVAATIYAVWRSRVVANTIDATLAPLGLPRPGGQLALSALRTLLERFALTGGVGASGVDFFKVPEVADAADRRDLVILGSLAEALDRLAGGAFAAAFGGSVDQEEYRWGKLHRVVLDHPLGGPFDIPPAGGAFPHPLGPALPGIPTDGGFGTVDAAAHDVRAAGSNAFMFGSGPAQRFVAEAPLPRIYAETSLPGGVSGVPGSPEHVNLLRDWLTNDTCPLLLTPEDVRRHAATSTVFVPGD